MLKYTNGQAFNELERMFESPSKLIIVGSHDATISVMAATFLSRGANFLPLYADFICLEVKGDQVRAYCCLTGETGYYDMFND